MGIVDEVVVYIIATHFGTYYCGMTNSLLRRWKEHVKGESKYLSIYVPKEVVHVEWFESYEKAAKREKEIKRGGVGLFYKKLKYNTGCYNDKNIRG